MPAKIAILIDAENVDPSFANQIFSYARSLGEVTIREIYGSGISLNEWAEPILENTIHPNFTLRPNRFKNSSDIALTIGAMELLSASRTSEDKKVDAVIIASSDSDFSPLAFHLRAAGIDVIGMGEPGRINPMWPKACTEFVTLTPGQPLMRKRETAPSDTLVVEAPLVPVTDNPSPQPIPEELQSQGESLKVKVETNPASKVKDSTNREKENVKVIAPSHPARVQIIRNFITEQLAAHDGVMKSGELFKALASVPDYKFDQQRSRRKPLDYLEKQYGEWFVLEPGENGSYWVSARSATPSVTATSLASSVDHADEQSSALDEQLGVDVQPAAEEPAASSLPDDPHVALIESGIPIQDAGHVADILSESKNLFAAYNGLTKAFGRKIGSQYYKLIKERFEAPAPVPADPVQMEMSVIPSSTVETEQPAQDASEQPQQETTLEQFFIGHGVEAAAQIASIVAGTSNLRIAYNELRKAFGATDGRAYLALVKEYRSISTN